MSECRKAITNTSEVQSIFGNMPQFLMLHSKFLRKLKEHEATLTPRKLMAIFLQHFDFVPFYEKYITLHKNSFAAKANLEKQYPDLKIAIEVCFTS